MPPGWKLWLGVSAAVWAAILLCAEPYNYIDTFNYARHIVMFHSHAAGPAFWDFGHALWRPLGYVVWRAFHGPLDAAFPDDPALAAGTGLIAISVVGAFVSAVLVFLLTARATGKAWVASATAIGFLSTDAAINYATNGTAYMAGGSLLFVALYLLLRAIQENRLTAGRGLAAGVSMALSVGLWFPFSLALPGLLCFGLLWPGAEGRDLKARLRFMIPVAVGCAAILLAIYGGVMAEARIGTLAEARNWLSRNRYGIESDRGYVRLPAGITRGFLYLGQDTVMWKRLLFGGTGGRPGLAAVAASGLWKVAIVHLVLLWVAFRLWRERGQRTLLACLAVAALPTLYFAAFLFDPGPPERHYADFPLLFLAFGCILGSKRGWWLDRAVPLTFFSLMLVVNVNAMWRFHGNGGYEDAILRLNILNPRVTANDRILLMSFLDPVSRFVEARPFDPASRNRYQIYVVTQNSATWEESLAASALDSLQRGGHIWVSLRLLAASPRPEWGWVAGDSQRIPWASIPAFFGRFDLLPSFGGEDGFAELAPSEKNLALLREASTEH